MDLKIESTAWRVPERSEFSTGGVHAAAEGPDRSHITLRRDVATKNEMLCYNFPWTPYVVVAGTIETGGMGEHDSCLRGN